MFQGYTFLAFQQNKNWTFRGGPYNCASWRSMSEACVEKKKPPTFRGLYAINVLQFTVMLTAADGIPFATTTSELAPVSIPEGTSNFVETSAVPVATPIVLWLCVLA
jgi:hypothetical protein